MSDSELSMEDSENDSDMELQEAFVKGLLKPGLNIETVEKPKKVYKNNVTGLKEKLSDIELKLKWIERLDLVNKPAPLAPELAFKLQEEETAHEAKLLRMKAAGGKKKKKKVIIDSEDPTLNDFRREMLFNRQAQAAILTGIPQLKNLGVKTRRPDDYFAEMAKSDQHMQKVRENLQRKQIAQERSERAKEIRQLRLIGKKVQAEARVKQAEEKRKMLEEVKDYRKGLRKDLDFLDDKKKPKPKPKASKGNKLVPKRISGKRKYKDQKFGYGGKRRGSKWNTKESADDVSGFRKSGKPNLRGQKNHRGGGGGGKKDRPGKNKRIKIKARGKNK